METLANLESFVRSARGGNFSEAARTLGLTPAAVSRNVAMLERNLGIRLFQRSTRKLTLTEAGERFLASVEHKLDALQGAIAETSTSQREPSGTLRVSISPTIGIRHVIPLLPGLLERYPRIRPEWHFDNRPIDLIAERYDAAIGGGFDIAPGFVSRTLAPLHLVVVASPAYMATRKAPVLPSDLAAFHGVNMRSHGSGRIREWTMRNARGRELKAQIAETIVMNDPDAIREAVRCGAGIAILAMVTVLPELERGELIRLLPGWHTEAGTISLYYESRRLGSKTRVFVDAVVDAFREHGLDKRLDARRRMVAK